MPSTPAEAENRRRHAGPHEPPGSFRMHTDGVRRAKPRRRRPSSRWSSACEWRRRFDRPPTCLRRYGRPGDRGAVVRQHRRDHDREHSSRGCWTASRRVPRSDRADRGAPLQHREASFPKSVRRFGYRQSHGFGSPSQPVLGLVRGPTRDERNDDPRPELRRRDTGGSNRSRHRVGGRPARWMHQRSHVDDGDHRAALGRPRANPSGTRQPFPSSTCSRCNHGPHKLRTWRRVAFATLRGFDAGGPRRCSV